MKKIHAITAAVAVLIFSACNQSDFEGFTKAENGLHYKFFNQNEDGPKAQEGEGISIRYTLKTKSKDSTFFDSKMSSPDGVNKLMLMKSTVYGGIEDALKMMAKGDSAEFILNADSFFLKTNGMKELPPFVKQGEHLVFTVKMMEIRTKKELEENQKMQMAEQEAQMKVLKEKEAADLEKYIADNKITVKPTASGLYFIETKKGTGASPKPTDIIKFNYAGKFLDGREFDSSKGTPIEYPLNQLVPGWIEAIQMMKRGGKANLVLPSSIGYGPQGYQGIPPYTPLTFEIELVDFKPAPEQPAAQVMPEPGK